MPTDSSRIEWNVEDKAKFQARLRTLADPEVWYTVIGRALYRTAELILKEAKRLTPVQFGILRASGHIEGPLLVGEDIEVWIVFGGPARAYAVIVHEDLTAHHAAGTQAKYLEKPFVAHYMEAREELVRQIAKVLAGELR